MSTNPTPEEIVETAKSGQTGMVKTLSDIRFEKIEKELAEIRAERDEYKRTIEEFRSANSEMFAYISKINAPAAAESSPNTVSASIPAGAPVSAQVVKDDSAEIAAKKREENNLDAVLVKMGYKKPASQSPQADIIPNDGM